MLRQAFYWIGCLLLVAGVWSAEPAVANTPSVPVLSSGPQQAQLGAYIRDIHHLDIKANTVQIDVLLWMIQPATLKDDNPFEHFEITNAQHVERDAGEQFVLPNGDRLYSESFDITASQNYDLSTYPMDAQVLELQFEDTMRDKQQFVFTLDERNLQLREAISLSGWKLLTPSLRERTRSHFGGTRVVRHRARQLQQEEAGDATLQPVAYSQVVLSMPIQRIGRGYFFKLFSAVFLASAVAFLCFLIQPSSLEARLSLGVGALFAVVASNFVLSSMLPETHLVTLGEQIVNLSYGAIYAVILESAVAFKYGETGHGRAALRLDRCCGIGMPLLYVSGIAWMLHAAHVF